LAHIKKTHIEFRPGCVQQCIDCCVTVVCSFFNLSSTCTLLHFCPRVLLCSIDGHILEKYHPNIWALCHISFCYQSMVAYTFPFLYLSNWNSSNIFFDYVCDVCWNS